MKFLQDVFNFYINSSIHVALAVTALTWITFIQLNLGCDKNLLYFVFFASISAYNFVKYYGLAKFHHRSLANWLKVIQVFSFFVFILMCIYFLKINTQTKKMVCLIGFVTFLYAIPIIPQTYFLDNKKNLRQISGLKIYIIALVWMFTTVVLPVVEKGIMFNAEILIICVQRFMVVLVLMLPFEIRDLNYDSLKLTTMPQRIGVKKTKFFGAGLLFICFCLEFFKDAITQKTVWVFFIINLVMFFLVFFSNKKQSKYYASFWVEGLPIVWLLMLLFS